MGQTDRAGILLARGGFCVQVDALSAAAVSPSAAAAKAESMPAAQPVAVCLSLLSLLTPVPPFLLSSSVPPPLLPYLPTFALPCIMSLVLGDSTLAGLRVASEQENLPQLAAAAAQAATAGRTEDSLKG